MMTIAARKVESCGSKVVCLGGHGKNTITPDDWGTLKGTHAYEIICSLGNRVERKYIA